MTEIYKPFWAVSSSPPPCGLERLKRWLRPKYDGNDSQPLQLDGFICSLVLLHYVVVAIKIQLHTSKLLL